MALPNRLLSLYNHCIVGEPLWDLCCDHGQLGLWALHSGAHPEVIFNDIVAHVLEPLPAKFLGRNGRVVCSPAENIQEPLTGNVVIAGIGGERIIKILRAHTERGNLHAKRIAVCPEKDAEWLLEQPIPGYRILSKREIPHNHGTRWVVVYEPSASHDNDG